MSKKKTQSDDAMTTLLGGVEIEVAHLPSGAFDGLDEPIRKRLDKFQALLGTTEKVKVRQVLLSQMAAYGNAILFNDECAAIEIYCGKDPGWADTLTPESINAVADKGVDINLPFFSAWFRRQAKWKEVRTPEAITNLQTQLTELMNQVQSLSRSSSSSTSATTV